MPMEKLDIVVFPTINKKMIWNGRLIMLEYIFRQRTASQKLIRELTQEEADGVKAIKVMLIPNNVQK